MTASTVALDWYTFRKKLLDIGADAGVNVENRVGWGRIRFFFGDESVLRFSAGRTSDTLV